MIYWFLPYLTWFGKLFVINCSGVHYFLTDFSTRGNADSDRENDEQMLLSSCLPMLMIHVF